MIHYVNVSGEIVNRKVKINLAKVYDHIGLVKIVFPKFTVDAPYICVEIQVDEIDKTYENRHRVLSRLYFDNKEDKYFYKYETNHIQWQKLDSQRKEVNLTFASLCDEQIEFQDYQTINITLALL